MAFLGGIISNVARMTGKAASEAAPAAATAATDTTKGAAAAAGKGAKEAAPKATADRVSRDSTGQEPLINSNSKSTAIPKKGEALRNDLKQNYERENHAIANRSVEIEKLDGEVEMLTEKLSAPNLSKDAQKGIQGQIDSIQSSRQVLAKNQEASMVKAEGLKSDIQKNRGFMEKHSGKINAIGLATIPLSFAPMLFMGKGSSAAQGAPAAGGAAAAGGAGAGSGAVAAAPTATGGGAPFSPFTGEANFPTPPPVA